MFKALLLDLDNTLVLYNEAAFLRQYFAKVSAAFADLIPPESLSERILMSTVALSTNDGTLNNADYFVNTFLDPGADRKVVWDRFLTFYQTDYRDLRPAFETPEGLSELLSILRANDDMKLILATNPIYPLAAYDHRLSWIDLSLTDFDLITHMENTGYVKPNPGYFRQIASQIELEPEACLMVGNDPVHDIAASAVGMKTYLTTEAPENDYTIPGIPRSDHPSLKPDHSGPLSGIVEILS
jgi:HAD superfamily hydrolase (TIGR01549 family)